MSEESILMTVEAFTKNGFFARRNYVPNSFNHSFIKDWVRIDWTCGYPVNNSVFSYPGVYIPIQLFEHPKAVEFLDTTFIVPSPPEEYLRLKYGDQWIVPKKPGAYEIDVVEKIPAKTVIGELCHIRVLDTHSQPVPNAEISLVDGERSKTDEQGYAKVILPEPNWYALIIRHAEVEKVLYMEELNPGVTHVYRPDPPNGLPENAGTLGNVLFREDLS